MSDNEDYSWFYIIIPILVLWFIFSGSDLKSFFSSDKTESWIKPEWDKSAFVELKEKKRTPFSRINFICTPRLDFYWAYSMSNQVKIKCKLRKSISGKDSYDFIYEIQSKLAEPKLREGYENYLVKSYFLKPVFKFIDEDGFVLRDLYPEFISRYRENRLEKSDFAHEKNVACLIWEKDDYPFNGEVTASVLIQDFLPAEMVKRISKINYELGIHAEIEPIETKEVSDTYASDKLKDLSASED